MVEENDVLNANLVSEKNWKERFPRIKTLSMEWKPEVEFKKLKKYLVLNKYCQHYLHVLASYLIPID